VIGVELDYTYMAEMVDNITLYDNGYAFVNDSEGNIVYHPRMDVTTMGVQPAVPEGLLGDAEIIKYTYEGVDKIAVVLPLVNGDRLNVSVPEKEVYEEMQKWINVIIIVFFILLAIFISVIMRYTGKITRPLQELTEVAEQIDKGNYNHSLNYKGDDEIGVLTQTFNSVTNNLNNYITDLNNLTKQLTLQKESLSALLNNMPAISFTKDAETGVYLACNQAFADYAHILNPEEVV
jgi:methyl-accepting chemotaxis protein